MITKYPLFSISVICFVLLFACNKKTADSNSSNGNNNSNISITATINGKAYASKTVYNLRQYSVYAFNSLGDTATRTLGFGITFTSPGTYSLMQVTTDTALMTYNYKNNIYTSQPSKGTIIISTNNGSVINGTFYATLYNIFNSKDSVLITNGTFTNLPIK